MRSSACFGSIATLFNGWNVNKKSSKWRRNANGPAHAQMLRLTQVLTLPHTVPFRGQGEPVLVCKQLVGLSLQTGGEAFYVTSLQGSCWFISCLGSLIRSIGKRHIIERGRHSILAENNAPANESFNIKHPQIQYIKSRHFIFSLALYFFIYIIFFLLRHWTYRSWYRSII